MAICSVLLSLAIEHTPFIVDLRVQNDDFL